MNISEKDQQRNIGCLVTATPWWCQWAWTRCGWQPAVDGVVPKGWRRDPRNTRRCNPETCTRCPVRPLMCRCQLCSKMMGWCMMLAGLIWMAPVQHRHQQIRLCLTGWSRHWRDRPRLKPCFNRQVEELWIRRCWLSWPPFLVMEMGSLCGQNRRRRTVQWRGGSSIS